MQKPLTLLLVTCLAAPGIAAAQTGLASAPVPEPRPPLRLFTETVAEPGAKTIEAIKSSSWWEPPTGNNEVPRWQIGYTAAVNAPGGLELTAGFFARRADPLPLFLSEGIAPDTRRLTSNSVTDPATHRLRLDAKFGVSKLLRDGPQLKVNAIGEVFIPLKGTSSRSPAFVTSPGLRLGLRTAF